MHVKNSQNNFKIILRRLSGTTEKALQKRVLAFPKDLGQNLSHHIGDHNPL